MSLLTVNNLTKNFGGLTAVSNVNLKLDTNELVGLIGPNGAGKTTLFNLLTGVYVPSEGDVLFNNDIQEIRLNGKKPFKIANLGLSRTFQNIRLFKDLTVLDNVLIALNTKQHEGTLTGILRLPKFFKDEDLMEQKALKLLAIFDLAEKANSLAKNLSYGEQRRLEIVRALGTDPKLLFLDEPAAGMNPQETAELTELIKKIQKEFNLTILLIEHDMSLVMDVCERIYVLEYGQIIAEGLPQEIKENPRVIKAYLGGDL
ncbi:ABC transporter ATP-binding protein [Vagococcus vulneris]|uniref:ABC transporter ATP-binding protein n=1 Tax=Vagococcus vulneris TaxID=1977869 RepID=A0A430A1D1_9ENTE|nr:ABC transporter ATP-binding protein [Vagococcus vulneris]RSU00190.1 ABC transporter ATP-binding protein [Vagococcus vulneris]